MSWFDWRPSKHTIVGEYRSRRARTKAETRARHVAHVRDQSALESNYFAINRHKPPRKMRIAWLIEIARKFT